MACGYFDATHNGLDGRGGGKKCQNFMVGELQQGLLNKDLSNFTRSTNISLDSVYSTKNTYAINTMGSDKKLMLNGAL